MLAGDTRSARLHSAQNLSAATKERALLLNLAASYYDAAGLSTPLLAQERSLVAGAARDFALVHCLQERERVLARRSQEVARLRDAGAALCSAWRRCLVKLATGSPEVRRMEKRLG